MLKILVHGSVVALVGVLACGEPEAPESQVQQAARDAGSSPSAAPMDAGDVLTPADLGSACAKPSCVPVAVTADARVESEPVPVLDAGPDAGEAAQPSGELVSASGETCLGGTDFGLTCELELCGPAHYTYTNLSIAPNDVICLGGEDACPLPSADPSQEPTYSSSHNSRAYEVRSSSADLTIGFTAAIESAKDAADAQRSIDFARLSLSFDWNGAWWEDLRRNDIPGTSRIEVISYLDRRIHLRAFDDARIVRRSTKPVVSLCYFNGSPCSYDTCHWGDSESGGSGVAPSIELELAFTLPPATKPL